MTPRRSRLVSKAVLLTSITCCTPCVVAETSVDQGQDSIEESRIEEVIVTSTRSKRQAFELPFTVETLDQRSLSQLKPRNMPEALARFPGVLIQKTANGQGSPILRGFTGYRTLTLIDGVRYNNSVYRDGANEYFSLIDNNSLSNIELLSGPGSTLYGSDAIGGTLSLRTQSALDQSDRDTSNNYISGSQIVRLSSSENSKISRTEVSMGNNDTWGLRMGYTAKSFGDIKAADIGEQKTTGYDESAYDLRLDMQLNDTWALTALHQNLVQDDVWRTHSTIFAKSFAGTDTGTDLRRLKDQARSLSYIKFSGTDLSPSIDKIDLTLSSQTWDENGDRIKLDGTSINDYFDSRMLGIDLQIQQRVSGWRMIYGFDYYLDQVNSGRRDFNADGSLKKVRVQGPIGDDSNYGLAGLYIQAETDLHEKLSLSLGSRLANTRARVGAFTDPISGNAASFENAWTSLVHSIRATYRPDIDGLRIWGGLSQSFRAPNIGDLSRFGKSRSSEIEVAATGLDPEHFFTVESGVRYQSDNYKLATSYYHTKISDYITSTPTGNIRDGLTEVSKQNSASGSVEGIEISGSYYFNYNITLSGNTTWLDTNLEGEYLSRTMPLTSNLILSWSNNNDTINTEIELRRSEKADHLSSGDLSDNERIPPGGTPAYTLLNLRAAYQLNQSNFSLGLSNLTDAAYRTHGSGSNEPGRGVNLGFTLQF